MEKYKGSYLSDTLEYIQIMWWQLWFSPFIHMFNKSTSEDCPTYLKPSRSLD